MTDLAAPTKPPSDDDITLKLGIGKRLRQRLTVNHFIAVVLTIYLGGKTVCAHIWQGRPPGMDETLSVMKDCANCIKTASVEMQSQRLAFMAMRERREDCAELYGRASEQMVRVDDLLRSMKLTFRRFSDVVFAIEAKYGDKNGDK